MEHRAFHRHFTNNQTRLHSIRTKGGEVIHHGASTDPGTVQPIHAYAHQKLIDRWKKDNPDITPAQIKRRSRDMELGYSLAGQGDKHFISGDSIDLVRKHRGQPYKGFGDVESRRTIMVPNSSEAHEAAVLDAFNAGHKIPEHNLKAYPKIAAGVYPVWNTGPGGKFASMTALDYWQIKGVL